MSNVWPHATKAHPCPICGKPDWCSFGDRAIICRRVESNRPHLDRSGNVDGWYHFGDTPRPVISVKRWMPPPKPVAPIRTTICGENLAKELGVSVSALRTLGVGWSDSHRAWMWPMRNGKNEVVGWNRRFKDGTKKILAGTKAGLYIPQMAVSNPVFVCEGGSDTAALLDMGFFAIGRFNVSSGSNDLKEFFRLNQIFRCVIVADNDGLKNYAGTKARPGIIGAQRLKSELGIMSCVWIPPTPCKDVRDFIKRGGTRELIESDLGQKVWSRK